MKNAILKVLFFIPAGFPVLALNAQASLIDSIAGSYITCHVRTWEEREGNGIKVYETLIVPETLQVCTLTICSDSTFIEFEYGKESHGRYASRHYGKVFFRTGTWSWSHDTLILGYRNEKVYADKDRLLLIEETDMVKAYKDSPGLRMRSWKYSGRGKLCWKQDYNTYCIERDH